MSLVYQAIEIGSVHRSLFYRFISHQQILQYLLDNREVTPRRIAAYRSVCIITDITTILFEGKTFLELYNPIEYQLVTIYCNNSSSLYDRRDYTYLRYAIESTIVDSFLSIRIKSICYPSTSIEFSEDILYNNISITNTDISHAKLISCEHNILMSLYDTIDIDIILDRCELLIANAPEYWIKVGKSLYLGLLRFRIGIDYNEARRA